MTPQYTRRTARGINALAWGLFVPGVITAFLWSMGIIILDAIGGWLLLTAVTVALLILAFRVYGALRYVVLGALAIGGTCSVLGLTEAAGSTAGTGMFHWAAVIVWALGALIGGFGVAGTAGGAR